MEADEELDYVEIHGISNIIYDTMTITAYEVDGEKEIKLELPYGYTSFAYNAPAGSEFVHVYEDKFDSNESKTLKVIDEKETLVNYKGYINVPELQSGRATWVAPLNLIPTPVVNEIFEQDELIQGR